MSLLLEALKKAEKAKEEAQRRARGERPEPKATPTAVHASEARTPLEIVAEVEKLLESPIHEVRAGATSIMDKPGRSKKTT